MRTGRFPTIGSDPARKLAALAAAVVIGGSLLAAGTAVAGGGALPNGSQFQLDGNTLDDGETSPTDCPPSDWAGLYAGGGSNPCGSDGFVFIGDKVGAADTTYWQGGGSKDAYDPAVGPWLWGPNNVSPDKDDIVDAFAAAYHSGTGSGATRVMYFGADRYTTNGDAQMGFQFLQNATCLAGPVSGISAGGSAACPATTPDQAANAGKFVDPTTGVPVRHANGDLLVLVNFNNGGAIGLSAVFEWSGATTADPGGGSYAPVLIGSGVDCTAITDGSLDFCATANKATLTGDPVWPYENKSGGTSYQASALIEGGINLGAIAGAGQCFPSFLAETRSSAGPGSGLGLTAQLKDLAVGRFELCGSSLSTTPAASSGSISAGSVTASDTAELSVTGALTWSGTLDYYLCGPDATAGTCTSANGTRIGDPIAVNQDSTPGSITSATATVTQAGTYCFAGVFTSAIEGVPGQTDNGAGECFAVAPVTPAISTNATASVLVGNPIRDTATLTGTANQPGSPVINPTADGGPAGGTITFRAYGPFASTSTPACTGSPAWTSGPVTVSGDGSGYASGDWTPATAGTYYWLASYSGDVPNTGAVSGACGDAGEATVVLPHDPSISTTATAGPLALGSPVSYTAHLSGAAADAGGTITFSAYGPFSAAGVCTGTAAHTDTVAVSGNGDSTSGDFTPTAPGTYNWVASYSGDPPNTTAIVGSCGDDNESSVLISLQPTMATAQSFIPNDTATITVATGAGGLAGSVVFELYAGSACSGTPLYLSGPLSVADWLSADGLTATVPSANTTAYSTSQTFSWLVNYTSTNLGHENVSSVCGVETSGITIQNNGTPVAP